MDTFTLIMLFVVAPLLFVAGLVAVGFYKLWVGDTYYDREMSRIDARIKAEAKAKAEAEYEVEYKALREALFASNPDPAPSTAGFVATSIVNTILEDTGFADEDDPRFAGFSSPAKPKAPRKPRKARKARKAPSKAPYSSLQAMSWEEDFSPDEKEMADIRMMLGQ